MPWSAEKHVDYIQCQVCAFGCLLKNPYKSKYKLVIKTNDDIYSDIYTSCIPQPFNLHALLNLEIVSVNYYFYPMSLQMFCAHKHTQTNIY